MNNCCYSFYPWLLEVLEECRINLLEVDVREGAREKVPPLAFKTARAMKV